MDFKFRMGSLKMKANIGPISRVAEIYYIDYKRAPKDFRVEVTENEDGSFVGIANYAIWSLSQGDPYKSIRKKDSVHDALQDALEGVIEFDETVPDTVLFWEADDGTLFDCTGEKISCQEAELRRAAYRNCNNALPPKI
jgi:hypothetical protein